MRPSEWLGRHFWAKVDRSDPFGCWPWIGYCHPSGYGQLNIERRIYGAHRIAWMITFGTQRGLWVLHKCDHKWCVNPRHLYLGTNALNMQDAISRGRMHAFRWTDDGEFQSWYDDDSLRDLLLDEDLRDSPADYYLGLTARRTH